MTPLEIVAKAIKEQSPDIYGGVLLDESAKEIARAALLALADIDLPVGDEGIQVAIPMFGKLPIDHAILRTYQAILRAIANEDTTPDDQ